MSALGVVSAWVVRVRMALAGAQEPRVAAICPECGSRVAIDRHELVTGSCDALGYRQRRIGRILFCGECATVYGIAASRGVFRPRWTSRTPVPPRRIDQVDPMASVRPDPDMRWDRG